MNICDGLAVTILRRVARSLLSRVGFHLKLRFCRTRGGCCPSNWYTVSRLPPCGQLRQTSLTGVAPGAVMKMPAAVGRYLVAEQKKIMCSRENRFSLAVSRKGYVSPEKHFRMPRSL